MAKKKSPVEKLEKLSEDIEGLSFTDHKAWRKKRTELERLVKSLPGDAADAKSLCRLAAHGLELIGNQTLSATLDGVENILDALSIAIKLLTGDSDAGRQAARALSELEALIGSTAAAAGDAPIDHMPPDIDTELLNEFIAESSDLIEAAEEALLLLETDPEDDEAVGKVLRSFHTVKGTAAFLDLELIADLGHHAETLFSRVRDAEIRYGGGYADLGLRSLDMIKELVENVRRALDGAPLLKPVGYDRLTEVLVDPEAAGVSGRFDDLSPPPTGGILVAQGRADRAGVENALEAHPHDRTGEAMLRSNTASLTDVGQTLRTQRRMADRRAVMESTVRVSTQRLDRLIDMVGELVIAFSMVAQDETITGSDDHDLVKKVGHTGKIVRQMQDISMSMRMVPLKGTFNKMARLVRDLSRKVGKTVDFASEGEETEIDRNLVDIINDPLVHMIRNAVDHGVETPEERVAAGKSPAGKVKLSAYHSAGCVVVEIEDDGRGLDRAGILAKAGERGLTAVGSGSDGQTLSDRDVYNLIFEPGFSTAETVTDVSGRGVGMDVVRKNIESLRGQVEIRSEPGRGSLFKLSLPLTLAIIDGMVIRVGRETYVIPTVSIVRSVRPGPGDISTVLHKGEVLILPGGIVPLYRLAELYRLDGGNRDLIGSTVVVVEDDERQVGFVVDELVGRQQVVIKSLGETMRNIPGISGGAIMPDGRVGLILDIGGLIRFAEGNRRQNVKEDSGAAEQKSAAA